MKNNSPIIIKTDIRNQTINDQLSPLIVDAVQSSLQAGLAIIRDRWQSEAQSKLNSTRPLYLQGLQWDSVVYPLNNNPFTGAVILRGKLPNMIESGTSPWDMKLSFSKSNKRIEKTNGGWYLTIPMRHSTPGSFMYGKPMPASVYKNAKKLSNGKSLSYPGVGDKSWTGYQRKHTNYDGLTRIVKNYAKTTQSQYMTFRRVSDKSDPSSFWHPGFKGIKIAESLVPFAQKTFADLVATNLNAIT